MNGHRKRQEEIADILHEEDDDGPLEMVKVVAEDGSESSHGCSRIRSVVLAAVKLAKSGDPGAAAAQKTCMEFFAGKPRQQVDHSSEDGTMSPAAIEVVFTNTPTEPSADDSPGTPKG